ncbi:carboxypeptidase M32, partial [Paenibacillus glucanolyticus]
MAVQHSQQWEQFDRLVRKIMSYYEAIGLLHWDLRTGAPRKGTEIRSETIGVLSTEAFKLQISEEMGQLLSFFAEPEQAEQLDDRKRRMIAEVRKMYDQSKSIPPERFQEYSILAAQSETKWEEAKKNSDFEGFEPYLTKIVAFKQEFIEYWGVKDTRYDTLLDMYEPDLTVEKVDAIFERLKARLVPLVHAIQESSFKPETAFLKQLFPKEQQEKFSLFLLEQMGYDFEAGRLDESVHPFATGLNPGDVRITTMYLPDDVLSAVFSSLHEGGHALYEQNIDKTLAGTPLSGG